MDIGDNIPPMLYSGTVLRKAKQEELDKRLQLSNKNPVTNLQIAMHTTLLRSIRVIGADPFFCMYWLQEQQLLY